MTPQMYQHDVHLTVKKLSTVKKAKHNTQSFSQRLVWLHIQGNITKVKEEKYMGKGD